MSSIRKKLLLTFITIISGIIYGVYLDEINNVLTGDLKVEEIEKLQEQLDQYKEKEYQERLREIELQAMRDPQLVYDELQTVGELIVYQGGLVYTDNIIDKGFLNKKELILFLKYSFGISIDLSKIRVKEIIDDTVKIEIPKQELKLKYVELDMKETKVKSSKTMLAKQFKPEDVKIILDQSQQRAIDTLNANRKIFSNSEKSLQNVLRKMILKLGYKEVIFEITQD